jgi:hypothetical protein
MSNNPTNSVVGGGGRLPRRTLLWRTAAAVVLAVALITAKLGVSHGVIKVRTLAPPSRVVTQGLVIGPAPSDADLRELATGFRVDAVVNLAAPSLTEQVTAATLHLAYLHLPLASQTSPTWPELRKLAGFLRRYTASKSAVFVHDDVGGGRAVVTAAMLLILRGQAWPAVSSELTPGALGSMCDCQWRAIDRLRAALAAKNHSLAGNPYATARLDPW